MFDYSSDSLTDYVYSFPTSPVKPTPIVLERVDDMIIPTTPSQTQMRSIHTGEIPPLSTRKGYSTVQTQTQPSSSSDPDHESPKLPFITNVYIASITVVGLFLLFRMIQK